MKSKCTKCKTTNDKGAKVCSNCGADLMKQQRSGCIFAAVVIVLVVVISVWSISGGEEKAEKQLTAKELRAQEISKCFSAWDGSHIQLTERIKNSLNDEDSYEHERTVYVDMDSLLLVETTFSAKNGFGGRLKKTVIAQTNLDCEVVSIIQWYE